MQLRLEGEQKEKEVEMQETAPNETLAIFQYCCSLSGSRVMNTLGRVTP